MDAESSADTTESSAHVADYDQQVGANLTDVKVVGADDIAEAVALGLLSVFGAVGNCLTIFAVVINRPLRSQTSSFLIVNLAVCDMIVFVIIEPFLSVSSATPTWPFSVPWCASLAVLIVQHMLVSVTCMSAIAVNRYYSVVKRVSYRRIFTPRWTLVICLVTWVPGLALTLPMVLTPFVAGYSSYYGVCIITSVDNEVGRSLSLLTGMTILIGISVSSLCYLKIYRTVRDSRRRIQPAGPLAGGGGGGGGGGGDGGGGGGGGGSGSGHFIEVQPSLHGTGEHKIPERKPNNAKSPISRTEIAISLNLFVVFAVFCVCWAPLTVLIFVHNAIGVGFPDESPFIPSWAWQTAYRMVLFNSSLNVFIYAWRNRNFRSAYAKLLRCRRC